MAISDKNGQSFGGHLKEGAIVHPTAEIVIGEDELVVYTREHDDETAFSELVVTEKE